MGKNPNVASIRFYYWFLKTLNTWRWSNADFSVVVAVARAQLKGTLLYECKATIMQSDRQTDKSTKTSCTDRQTYRHTDMYKDRQTYRQTDMCTDRSQAQTLRHSSCMASWYEREATIMQADRQTYVRQTDRQTQSLRQSLRMAS